MQLALNCVDEEKPGLKWQEIFHKTWPYYKKWFLIEGHLARQGYLISSDELAKYMPELVPTYQHLCELAGGGDLASRYLSMYCPPPYLTGCTQLAWTKDSVSLIRNYDYNPRLFEGVMLKTNWLQPVIGISDCNWGLLDGINAHGLSASLTFGGRKVIGEGFGIPVVMRYVLETCSNVKEAIQVLERVPVHMSYNITLVDAFAEYATVYLSPDRAMVISKDRIAVNHQEKIEWHDYAAVSSTKQRLDYLELCLANPHVSEAHILTEFFKKPLYCCDIEKNLLTLYTAVYRPLEKSVHILWPEKSILQSFSHFKEEKLSVSLNPL